nr:hypothetical protein [Tanacetum cinerariifolium]
MRRQENKTEEGEQVYGLMAGFKTDFADHAGNAVGSVYDVAAEFAMMGISPKAKIKNKKWEVKLTESLARFDKWKESFQNLAKLINSSMSTRTKLGLGFKEYIGSDEMFDLFTPSVFDPEPDNIEVKSLYESDKSSESETRDFASCVSSPKTNDSFSTVDVKILPKSDVKDPSPTNGFSSCSFKENVKPLRNLYNKNGIADRIHFKNNFVRTKTCFICGSKSHLIKDCDVYDNVDNFPSVVSKAASVPAGSRNSSTSTSASRSIPAASRNRPSSIHTGRHIPAGRFNKPASFPAGRSVPTGWTNHAARPFFRPTNLYFDNVHPYVNKDIGIVDSGCSRSMTGNKEKLDDFVQVKEVYVYILTNSCRFFVVYCRMNAVSCGFLLHSIHIVSRHPMLLVVQVFLLVVLVHADGLASNAAGSTGVPAVPSKIISTVDGNEVVVTESLIRTQLQLNDENGLYEFTLNDVLNGMREIGTYNFSKFIVDGMIGNIGSKRHKILMYPRFLQMILGIQTTDPSPRPTFDFTAKLFSNIKLNWDRPHMPPLAPMLVVPAGGDGADAAAANEVPLPPPPPDVPPTHTSSSTPGPSTTAQDTPVRDPTPVREPTPSPVREPTTFWEPTPEPPRPPSPPPCTRSEKVGPTTSTGGNDSILIEDPLRPVEPWPTYQTTPFNTTTSTRPPTPPTTAATATGGAKDSVALTDLSLKLDRCIHWVITLENELEVTKKVLGGDEAATKEKEINLDALHELASTSLGGDTTVEAAYTIYKASQDAHASSDAGHDKDEYTLPTTGGVSPGSSMDPAGQAAAAAPSSCAILAIDKGKSPMVDDSIPADLLTEQEQVLKNLHDYQLGEDLAKKLHAEQKAEFARQQEELAQKAQAKSVASPATQDWLELMAKIATNSALSKQLLGDDVNKDNMNERLGMLLMRKRRELVEQSRVKPMNKIQQQDFMWDFVKNQSASVYNQGWTMKQVSAASLQVLASVPAASSIAADVSVSAVFTTTTDVFAALALPADASTHGVESQEESTTVAFTSGVSHATPSSSRRHRKQIAKKKVTPIVDVADVALIKFYSASESDGDPSPYAPYVSWEMVPTSFGSIHAYYDMEEHTKHFTSLHELLHMVEKNDLRKLLGDVDKFYQRQEPDTFGLILWGDLRTVDGRVIYMFVDVSYPLSEATLTCMLKHGLEVPKLLVGGDLTMAEYSPWLTAKKELTHHKSMALTFSNPFMIDNLPKKCMVIDSPYHSVCGELASLEPTATELDWLFIHHGDVMIPPKDELAQELEDLSRTGPYNKCLTGKISGYDSLRNSNAYKEHYAVATGVTPPKPKASVRKTRSNSDTTITPPTAATGPRLTTFEKDEGTGTLPWVPDVPTDESEEEISWNSTDEECDDDEGKDGEDKNDDEGDDGEERDDDDDDNDDDEEQDDDDEGNDEENLKTNVGREEGYDEEEEEDELYRDVNINQGRGIQTTKEFKDSHVTLTLVNLDGQQQSSSVSSQFVTSMLNPTPDAGMEPIFETTSQMDVQTPISSDRLRDEAQADNDEFLKTIDESMQKIIKEHLKEQVKVQVSNILQKIEQTVNEQLEAEVLTRSSNSSKTSYVVAADLSEMELKKIIIEKMKGNKETVTLKRRRDDDADKDEEPSPGSDRGSKRHREGKEPESASAPTKKATRSAGKSIQGSKSRQTSASKSDVAEEPMQTTFEMEKPSHLEFETSVDDQPIVQSSQHPEWFSQQQKPPTPDHDWNKTLPATHESIQPWISELAKQSDSRSSFNELMDTPMDFYTFLMNRLRVDTLTPRLLAGPTYKLMKGIIVVIELKIVELHNYKHLDWITVRRDDDKLYKFKEGDFKRLRIQDIEDMLLLLVQGKLTNLTVKERFAFNVSL